VRGGEEGGIGWGSRAILWGALAFLYLPILVLAFYSFNDSRFALAWEGFTLDWYRGVFANAEIGRAARNSLVVSTTSTFVSVIVGTLLGLGLHFTRFRGREALWRGFYLPMLVPDIIQAVALLSFFAIVALPLGIGSIILAHISFQVSFVALLVRARLDAFPEGLVEAARDLGATPWLAMRRIVLPLAMPGIVAGGLVALTLSVDDFLIAYFTAGPGASTLPIRIYSMIRRGVTPEVNALATLLLVFSLVTMTTTALLLRETDILRPRGADAARMP
jgi:ABC-type spermidine/putrescine transport system permease subunit II